MPTVGDELRAVLADEVEKMSSPEATALFKELGAVIVRKLDGDNYKGSHAVALGAVTMTLVMLLKSMSADPGVRNRLKAAVKGMLDVDLPQTK